MADLMAQWRAFAGVLSCREGEAVLKEEDEKDGSEALQRTLREMVCPCAPWWDRGANDYWYCAPGVWKKVIEGWRKAARKEMAAVAWKYAEGAGEEESKKDDEEEGSEGRWAKKREQETRRLVGICTWAESLERGPLRQREYNVWMYAPLFSYTHSFPCWSFHLDVLGVKRALWARWGGDFDVRTLREVFPENEIAEWVIEARKEGRKPEIDFRAEEMAYERDFSFGEIGWPTRIRPYAEEVALQSRRRYYREKEVVWDWPEEACWLPDMTQEIYAGEEVPDVLIRAREVIAASENEYWRRRRNPERAQHDAQEPDMWEWDERQQRKKRLVEEQEKVSARQGGNGNKEREKKGEKEGKGRKGEEKGKTDEKRVGRRKKRRRREQQK